MAKGKEMFLGLNQNGLILFIVLVLVCLPLCWIPWIVDACKCEQPEDSSTDSSESSE